MQSKKSVVRKMYKSEFLVRSNDPDFIIKLKKIAAPKKWSVNTLIVNEMEKLILKNNA